MSSEVVKEITVRAPLRRVWAALTDNPTIAAWMDDESARIDPQPGGECSFFEGSTTGHVVKVEAPRLLEYTWRQAEWPPEWADSKVVWELEPIGRGVTRLKLRHSDFPNEAELASHDDGWDTYWLRPMVDHLESAPRSR
ncbi:MAG: SRPBCC domain-containing protein [Candidatus Dormibacterales bacterium]